MSAPLLLFAIFVLPSLLLAGTAFACMLLVLRRMDERWRQQQDDDLTRYAESIVPPNIPTQTRPKPKREYPHYLRPLVLPLVAMGGVAAWLGRKAVAHPVPTAMISTAAVAVAVIPLLVIAGSDSGQQYVAQGPQRPSSAPRTATPTVTVIPPGVLPTATGAPVAPTSAGPVTVTSTVTDTATGRTSSSADGVANAQPVGVTATQAKPTQPPPSTARRHHHRSSHSRHGCAITLPLDTLALVGLLCG